jgi:hypothetical protein
VPVTFAGATGLLNRPEKGGNVKQLNGALNGDERIRKRAFMSHVRKQFPGMPARDQRECAEKYARKKSPAHALRLLNADFVASIVRSHIRHVYTKYDLLRNFSKEEARLSVRKKVVMVMRVWRVGGDISLSRLPHRRIEGPKPSRRRPLPKRVKLTKRQGGFSK